MMCSLMGETGCESGAERERFEEAHLPRLFLLVELPQRGHHLLPPVARES
jgi:hypothetical protein